jgi:hypothetical protein
MMWSEERLEKARSEWIRLKYEEIQNTKGTEGDEQGPV